MQTSIQTVVEHLIFPHKQFARKQEKTLYSFSNAKVHSQWERGEKTHARKTISVTNEKHGQAHEGTENVAKRAKCSWPGAFTGLWQICKVTWENLRRKYVLCFIGSIGLHAAVPVHEKVSIWGTAFSPAWSFKNSIIFTYSEVPETCSQKNKSRVFNCKDTSPICKVGFLLMNFLLIC